MIEAGASEGRIATLEAEVARLQMALEEASDASRGSDDAAAALALLADRLQWENAPRSLRSVLPLARLLRRVSASIRGGGGETAVSVASVAPVMYRQRLSKRVMLRAYILTRPVVLPAARRLHRLLSRLLEREGLISQREAVMTSGIDPTSELLRSIEAAMLTLALQRNQNG